MKTRSLLTLVAFCIAGLMAWAEQQTASQAPTLADIARQKRAQKAKRVYSSEDMKAAEAPAPTAEAPEGGTEAKPAAAQSSEVVAAAEAKVADLRDRELLLNKNIARFETSLSTASEEGNEDRVKTYTESIETAKANLAETTTMRIAAEKQLDEMKAAAAAAAARKRPARKPAATAPKT